MEFSKRKFLHNYCFRYYSRIIILLLSMISIIGAAHFQGIAAECSLGITIITLSLGIMLIGLELIRMYISYNILKHIKLEDYDKVLSYVKYTSNSVLIEKYNLDIKDVEFTRSYIHVHCNCDLIKGDKEPISYKNKILLIPRVFTREQEFYGYCGWKVVCNT